MRRLRLGGETSSDFDVVVIGGGHAGCEAAMAAARMGCRTALLSLNPERIGFMSCNPAIGGLAKGQLVKEIDALGGVMGRITDVAAIQYRRLNSSKGPAVRSSRAQCDKALYSLSMRELVNNQNNLTIISMEAVDIIVENGAVSAVGLRDGSVLSTRSAVITSGTFLRAIMHVGEEQASGGRAGDAAATGLSGSLEKHGFKLHRLKTGTPPRLHRASIDFSRTERQPGDERPMPFSFYHRPDPFPFLPQISCFITHTNERTHEVVEANFGRSPMFTGVIQGIGPRYCPSIEDKVKRFRERDRHQLFLEPEGLTTDEIYVNGISTSLPRDVQELFVRSIEGLEKAQFIRHGYAVEYDAIDARQLRATLESKDVPGLFFAGQINGTSGYEEAGAQGLMAGVNAALGVLDRDPYVMTRAEGYIGVLIDDLVTKGADEPYRMFTSRAEYRLLLREDNADLRLSGMGVSLGLLGDRERRTFDRRVAQIEELRGKLARFAVFPNETTRNWLAERGIPAIKDRISGDVFLRRPEISWKELRELGFDDAGIEDVVADQVEIQTKYQGYIQRDLDLLEGVRRSESTRIPMDLCFDDVPGLSNEVRGRLKDTRPETLGQVSRMSGLTPAAVATLMIYIKTHPTGMRSGEPFLE